MVTYERTYERLFICAMISHSRYWLAFFDANGNLFLGKEGQRIWSILIGGHHMSSADIDYITL